MNSLRRLLAIGWVLTLATGAFSEPAVEATVSSRLVAAAPVLPGERVTYEVEVLSNALSFEGLRVVPPAVTGGLLLSDAASTLRGTRRVGGKSLQYVSYRFPVYPRRPGKLWIAPTTVSFTASLGYGQPSRAFHLETAGQTLAVATLPETLPLAAAGLSVSATLDPAGEAVRVGDARTLTITRRLEDAPALLLDPLTLPQLSGVAVYPGIPELIAESARGRLTGVRRDRFTLVFEAAGSAELPALRFPWWDLETGAFRTETLPAFRFKISGAVPAVSAEKDGGARWMRGVTVVLALVLLMAALLVAVRRRGAGDEPRRRLATLRRAARRNDPRAAHIAFLRWWAGVGGTPAGALAVALRELEEALVAGRAWDGRALRRALREHRRQTRRRVPALAPLNPGD
ncbi:BatD family protein [Pseudohaliea rubra]|uniref:BatD n=1 Tax=Pseudohaliea rubra DSM 19751 TaxID=1265313 RepID=A0A095XX38_9GAMM|nr:BatD family protein [Pseudohaliea rubra]KGE04261.1 BatD [Pseudohaliea rubra DSM 19751]